MARPKQHNRRLTKRQLRAKYASVRKEGRILQKKGLISPRVDFSKAKPSLAVRKKIESLRGIFTGTQQAIALPDWMRAKHKLAGRRTIGKYTIISKKPFEKIKQRKSEILITSSQRAGAYSTILPPVSIKSIPSLINWIRRDPSEILAMLPPGVAFGFTFFGNNSRELYTDPLDLADTLEYYPVDQADAWENFILVRIVNPASWDRGYPQRGRFKRTSKSRPRNVEKRSKNNREYYIMHREEILLKRKQYMDMLRRGR